jgi:chromate transporter
MSSTSRIALAVIALATFGAIGLLHWPLVWIVLGLGSLSCIAAWWRLGP